MEEKKSSQKTPEPLTGDDARLEGIGQGLRETLPCGPDETLNRIKTAIRDMPTVEPPADLLPSIMQAVDSRKIPLWLRAYKWVRSPKSITFTPLQMVPAFALTVFLLISVLHLYRGENRDVAFNREVMPVVLSLNMPGARSVHVIGSFNNWVPQPCELREDNGRTMWTMKLDLPPGRYEYVFVVDGDKMIPDPGAELYQDDGFGNRNNILAVGNRNEAI